MSHPDQPLVAYALNEHPSEIVCAERERDWMDRTHRRHAYKCLPLLMANMFGWDLLCPYTIHACWNGEQALDAVQVTSESTAADLPLLAHSHFGHGILTFAVGFLFRTPPGFNLWVKGPANRPKPYVTPLEGIVETDWAHMSFTMNWQCTEPHRTVTFQRGEPFCTVVPVPRGQIESFVPEIRPISSDSELEKRYRSWSEARDQWNLDLKQVGSTAEEREWQRDYYTGTQSDGSHFGGHQTRIDLRPFTP